MGVRDIIDEAADPDGSTAEYVGRLETLVRDLAAAVEGLLGEALHDDYTAAQDALTDARELGVIS